MTTVGQLIYLLQEEIKNGLSPDALIVLSKDAEGNGFSPCSSLGIGVYESHSTWSGEFYDDAYLEEETEFPPAADSVPAVSLWPTN